MAKRVYLTALSENFGGKMSGELLKVWLELLKSYSVEQVAQASIRVIENYEYKTMPPFAVLKKELDALQGEDEAGIKAKAIAEWDKVLAEVQRVGSYGQPKFENTTALVVRMLGGWEAVCSWETKNLDFKRNNFLDLWLSSHGKEDNFALPGSDRPSLQIDRGPQKAGDNIQGVLEVLERGRN